MMLPTALIMVWRIQAARWYVSGTGTRCGVGSLGNQLNDPNMEQDGSQWRLAPGLLPPTDSLRDLREVGVGIGRWPSRRGASLMSSASIASW